MHTVLAHASMHVAARLAARITQYCGIVADPESASAPAVTARCQPPQPPRTSLPAPPAAGAPVVVARALQPDPFGLPAGWKRGVDKKSGRTYYYNRELGRTQWTAPDSTEASQAPPGRAPPAGAPAASSSGAAAGDKPILAARCACGWGRGVRVCVCACVCARALL